MAECRELAAWAETLPLAASQPAAEPFITSKVQFMQATLPSRQTDDASGDRRAAVYIAILRGKSRAALTYLTERACRECRWFPTPRECLDILADFREPPSERAAVLRLCTDRTQAIADRWIADPDLEADVPEQWIGIAVERGTLRRLEGGVLVVRARYHGPFRPYGVQ